jgi:hypothetical protein
VNEQEQEHYEAELRRIPPAQAPADFMKRLQAARPASKPARRWAFLPAASWLEWWRVLRWAAPAMAMVLVVFLVGRAKLNSTASVNKGIPVAEYGMKASVVQVDQELVSSFDVVATLPGGQPVRFRCEQWKDQLVVSDRGRGVEIERNSPRVEVVPVRFEAY